MENWSARVSLRDTNTARVYSENSIQLGCEFNTNAVAVWMDPVTVRTEGSLEFPIQKDFVFVLTMSLCVFAIVGGTCSFCEGGVITNEQERME